MEADVKESGEQGGEKEPGEEQGKRWGGKGEYSPKCVEKEGDGEGGGSWDSPRQGSLSPSFRAEHQPKGTKEWPWDRGHLADFHHAWDSSPNPTKCFQPQPPSRATHRPPSTSRICFCSCPVSSARAAGQVTDPLCKLPSDSSGALLNHPSPPRDHWQESAGTLPKGPLEWARRGELQLS